MLTFIDWFAGVGGFRKGMENAGHKCIGFCEFDKYAVASYTSMHLITEEQRAYLATLDMKKRQKEILKDEYRNGEWYAADVRTVRAEDIPRADCWCFGFPCQDISVAGKQLGFAGHRSSLFFAVTKLIRDTKEEDRPQYLFIENVKNLLSVNRGFDFAKLLVELDEIGYDCEWQLLNSKEFGVPQNRERVFIIGHLRGRGGREVFPIEGSDGEDCVSVKGICNTNPSGNGMNGVVYDGCGLAPALTTNKGEGNKVTIPVLTPDRAEKRQNGRRFKDDGEPMFTLTGQDRHGVGVGVLRTVRSDYGKEIRKQYEAGELDISRHEFLEHDIREDGITNTLSTVQKDNLLAVEMSANNCTEGGEIAHCLNAAVKVNGDKEIYAIWYEKYQCYIAIRKLTPKECFRLQGWDDESFEKAEFVNSNSQLYKQAGNGVTVNVIEAIARKMQ
ncbi:DNA cytosine methyltransferase [Anaerotignum sp.]